MWSICFCCCADQTSGGKRKRQVSLVSQTPLHVGGWVGEMKNSNLANFNYKSYYTITIVAAQSD